ncbi:MAG: hypothetical protein A3G25_00680 [Betaproteobacteria bacterium RIFCSPLOWO2_12_FULL_63_13]|nr:MAG: hypothetical protein A3H32_12370 [Betaproteobacteria bacterium RIFCSPLOWO2_02_FULL_63_19]OGA49800.1 MAG: hypothetical protein A3G25_00680 [Betaproteobacteria bacterium RIFCSPLOWO2_12_FULL_63_13]
MVRPDIVSTLATGLKKTCYAFLILGGIAWVMNVPQYLGVPIIAAEWLGVYLAVGIAAALLQHPYGNEAGLLEVVLGVVAIAVWSWMSAHYNVWLTDFAGYTPQKYVPGIVALMLMMEALRKSCGLPITVLVWLLILYGLVGHLLPPPFQADRLPIPSYVMYLYADTNAVPGLVLIIIASLVLAFIVLGKLMEVSGATGFFTDLALATMGHRRGGPAKVAVIASSLFGSISGSPVSNIMSTGVITIPLMKRTGFRPDQAAAIEAVASTGGQIAPPVMGAAAFLIAEFLQITYYEVVIAAALPAFFYYLCLFFQIDAISARRGLAGLPRSELPMLRRVLKTGWVFIVPLALLIYLLFWKAYTPSLAALSSAALLLLFAFVRKRMLSCADWSDFIFGGGASMIPLVLIGAGAGVVVGVMNATGLGQSISFVLVQAGEGFGLLPMLMITALLSIVLGMGMPTTAIYVVLSIVIAPALVKMGVATLAAHLFIFYFGVLSFLTPPVAVSSFVAAGLAKASMWRTSWSGIQLAALAYLLPFLWVYNPALLLQGSWQQVILAVLTTTVAALVIAMGMQSAGIHTMRAGLLLRGISFIVAGLAIGLAFLWTGPESLLLLIPSGLGMALCFWKDLLLGNRQVAVSPANSR